jgi:plastocyanin
MKKIIRIGIILSIVALFSVLATSCGGAAAATGPNQVHMNDTNFTNDIVSIKKGEKITLVNDALVAHVIGNGSYDENGHAKPEKETGAPTVDATISGYGNQEFGPFNTAGTFHIYCITHQGMQLTITVK